MDNFSVRGIREAVEKTPTSLRPGHYRTTEPKPKCGYYHYSNRSSQGALICETAGFPDQFDLDKEDYSAAYSDQKLREFAQWALNLSVLPTHVRIVHHYNVSNGYSCPTVEAVYEKQEADND